MTAEFNGIIIHGELAEAVNNITSDEWAYLVFNDNISDQIYKYMDDNNISKSQLAGLLNTSKAYVSKVLSGDANMTFKTFTKILDVMGAKAITKIVSKESNSCWDSSCWIQFQDCACVPGSSLMASVAKKSKPITDLLYAEMAA